MEAIGELADEDIDALDDPAWTTIASARDAVLGAIEALRHLALPRYVEGREASYAERARQSDDVASIASPMWVTPWGPIVFGAEHQSAFAPPWLAARDALERARDAVGAASGEEARARELEWQTERLESLIL